MSVTIDKKVFDTAKQLGINVSQASENYLKLLISVIEKKAGGEGFEPSTPNLGDSFNAEDWQRFFHYLAAKKYRGGYERTLYNYAQRYGECLFKRDLTVLQGLAPSMRPNVLKALAALAKFSGRYEEWKSLIVSFGVSWAGRNADDVFIDRYNNVKEPGEVWDWVKALKRDRSELSDLLDLMSVSGLRWIEGVASHNLILDLDLQGKLCDYYREQTLEHFRYKEIFLRETKKAFVSFVPDEVITGVRSDTQLGTLDSIKKLVQKTGLPLRFGDIREAHASFMTKYLKPSEIDFLHGRVTSTVKYVWKSPKVKVL